MDETQIIPAATLVLYAQEDGQTRHLLLERGASLRFAAGALVFPGGRVDEQDREHAPALPGLAPDDAAARVAAIRETLEEAGLAIGIFPQPAAYVIEAWRAKLKEGVKFAALLAEGGHGLELGALTPFARWCPRHKMSRNFDTRFYVARYDGPLDAAEADGGESVTLLWLGAAEALAESDAGRHKLIFPTRRNLERLAAHPTYDEMLAHIAATPMATITPEIKEINGEMRLVIPEGLGYPVVSAPASEAAA
ncbi:NUDIX domain-containing protein [Acidocella sp.]|uniref:NUDIX hydrolase n=1 Tax=Acidocella sp. TaxID=50710 RepID=UPI002605A5D9|nr:NUDIX domain-containing protein [Acidocella sp.]